MQLRTGLVPPNNCHFLKIIVCFSGVNKNWESSTLRPGTVTNKPDPFVAKPFGFFPCKTEKCWRED